MEKYNYNCVLCSKRTKARDRRSVSGEANKHFRKFLTNQFFINFRGNEVSCNKCRHIYYKHKAQTEKKENASVNPVDPDYEPSCKRTKTTIASPPSITLPIASTVKGHSQCFICKKRGPKLIVVPKSARYDLFLEKEVLLPAGVRCCPGHISEDNFTKEAFEMIERAHASSDFNRTDLLNFIKSIREIALKNKKSRIDFDTSNSMSDADIYNLTGLNNCDFNDLCAHLKNIRDTHVRSMRTCVGIFLTKLKTGMSNKLLGTIFNINKDAIRKAVSSAREAVNNYFTPLYTGFPHISRSEIIQSHTRPLAQTLFGNVENNTAILVIDGTYIYIQKSQQFQFQRETYSQHKHRNLVKPMLFVSTTGYIVSIIGPYLCNSKNNDANILNQIFKSNIEEIRRWFQDQDVVIVDRGFRDSIELLKEFGINAEMPSFLNKNSKQFTVEEGNMSRLVTKVRWIVESVNNRLKQWCLLDRVMPNSHLPYVGEYLKFASALCNKYKKPLTVGSQEEDEILGAKMLYLSKQGNSLMERVHNEDLEKRSGLWKKLDANEAVQDFPQLTEDDIRNLTMGVYQLKLAKSYSNEHIDENSNYQVLQHENGLLRVRIESRHTNHKIYNLWISYNDTCITGWYCKCRSGARVVGTCSHVASVLWYLGYARHHTTSVKSKNWSDYVIDAQSVPEVVDDSDNDPEE